MFLNVSLLFSSRCLFFFTAPATSEIYTLSLHDALPILGWGIADPLCPPRDFCQDPAARRVRRATEARLGVAGRRGMAAGQQDRKSTRLNSSHTVISYAVFCLKKKKKKKKEKTQRTT